MRSLLGTSVAVLIRSALSGWAAMMAVFAVQAFLIPHERAPEVGLAGTFMLFGFVLSVTYVADFVILAVPIYLLLRRRTSLHPWQWASSGGILFILSLIVWRAVYGSSSVAELLFWAVLAGAAGAGSFYVLAPRPLRNQHNC